MMNQKYLLQYHEISNLSISDLITLLNNTPGLPCATMKVIDFIYCDNQPIHSGCGVYVFKQGKDIFYVGKSSSRSFVERIPAHFDLRHGVWFNTILRYVADHRTSTDKKTLPGIQAAGRYALDHLSVILINFRADDYWNTDRIQVLENLLRMTTKPVNAKKGGEIDRGEKVGDFVERHKRVVDRDKVGVKSEVYSVKRTNTQLTSIKKTP